MIIQTGLRTDIPAFYTPWFLRRLAEGFVLVRSPYAPGQVTRYCLSPEVVDCIGFCTKNPAPMLPHLDRLNVYGQFWYVTITPYGPDIEPHVPPAIQVAESLRQLSAKVGRACAAWRYDPILLTEEWTVERHLTAFETLCRQLEGAVDVCVISFIDLYAKVKRNFPQVREVPREDRLLLGRELAGIGAKYGIRLKSCCEGDELAPFGVDCSGCMTRDVYERAIGASLRMPAGSRSRTCLCHLSGDVGAYNTCGHGCRYCYANTDEAAVRRTMAQHDPASPLLVGSLRTGDVVRDARQESWRDGQMTLMTLL